ncbi:MAG: DUF4129 domain-containing protein [Leptolyngbyaceae cyanobacterium]
MTAESIQESNLPWQLRQLSRNAVEWIQLQLPRGEPTSTNEPPPVRELPDWLASLVQWGTVACLALLAAWLLVRMFEAFAERRRQRLQQEPVVATLQSLQEQHTSNEWLRRAKEFEQQGRWAEACRALYLAALQLLHDRSWIPHQPSRTNGEYLQAIQALQRPRPWQLLVRTHERSHFGTDALTAENVQRCRQAYQEVEKR